jgi:alcohol dehydrogenase class IV
MKQQEYFGFNSIENLKNILIKEKSKNILLVTGKKSFELSGAKNYLRSLLKDYNVYEFNDFKSNPDIDDINKGCVFFNDKKIDIIIGVGGGSSIDVAKAIKLFYYNDSNKKIPLIAIPTTSGSGSEATYFIVYYDKKEKQSKGIPEVTLPDYTICDPQLTMSLPKKIAASTGMDAMTQAIESYWSTNSTEESKEFAKKAIFFLINNLENAVNNSSKESKEKVMKAANLAGKAINITKTTACHSISYPLTSYFNIPHGHAAALTLGEMLIYNFNVTEKDCLDKRGVKYVKKTINELIDLIRENDSYKVKNKIQNLMENIGLETRLSQLGLKETDMDIIIQKGFNLQRVKSNPRLLNEENLKGILKNIM